MSDAKSCYSCHQSPKRANRLGCNEEMLKVDNGGVEIAVVRFEHYMLQFKNVFPAHQEQCDIIMADSGVGHDKIVFCELCCYEEKYVEPNAGSYIPQGKRAKARQQMQKSIAVLISDSFTAAHFLSYPKKVCLFAWRDFSIPETPVAPSRGDARANMQVFGSVVSNMTAQTTSHCQIMEHGFTFLQVKYPSVYKW